MTAGSGPVAALIPAAGRGTRLGETVPKAFVELDGVTLLELSASAARRSGVVDVIVVAAPPELLDRAAALVPDAVVVPGGAERSDSVRAGLAAVPDAELILVHDAARALTPPALFASVVTALRGGADAVVPGIAVADTLKRVDADGLVRDTPDRSELRAVQTPQGFTAQVLRRAHDAQADATDDAGLVEALGIPVRVIPGDAMAFKVTTQFDLALARLITAQEH
ncbi:MULTISPECIES: 2-C-methyl-D-erythritol 4-phosphate cytidylyltransferase [Gordonia]|uniref:2-C-methyl-D-erythritol 4-phosphate cytidylyltransferase n=1 Tax=Gordonia TaxID=2053 RepID=UPI00058718A4|nr:MULTISPECIES: 2-C-methyl-D-erythritol 4-phosphate cytidylyltransferase [Gordonia]AUH70011.1 2-C-methyl-D-erythritol 4-phosphate cytidylyltransferase [Gordonia sp. YC-JH1]MBY4569158.1 2-C-methyl-D-erythritol 4-phosphate cytidylyltransferase [Gordonia sihwensis]